MKKVRFETPIKPLINKMDDSECHSPRPLIERGLQTCPPELSGISRVLPYTNDPIQRFESSNSSPFPTVNRLHIPYFDEKELCWKPSDDLNLSLLDASNHEPRQPTFHRSILKENVENKMYGLNSVINASERRPLSTEKNTINNSPNVLVEDNSFFLKRDNMDKYHFNVDSTLSQMNRLNLGKENNPLAKKTDIAMKTDKTYNMPSNKITYLNSSAFHPVVQNECRCHHCIRNVDLHCHQHPIIKESHVQYHQSREKFGQTCSCSTPRNEVCTHSDPITRLVQQNVCKRCTCHTTEILSPKPENAIKKKTWAIEKYEQTMQPDCLDIEKQSHISKEKREPTVADLFKIIKLQNEQLQLLQEKVDKFISRQNPQPTITCSTGHVAVNTIENDQHKMSIGVMTSFEMIRTSTVINKEVVQQTDENAQVQCNRSQISIKEVVSKPVNTNFLDGITPKNMDETKVQIDYDPVNKQKHTENDLEEKTLNELSLYNVQVDNATTPLMSPDQTLYLDVRDYSDSESSCNNQSNVGWTYYNKVMTHVNGMLQDSEMPSSASVMYRNMRQQCIQMHIDKTNLSVTKRVKFGDDPLGIHQPHIYAAPATETSLKINQLAAKYLKNTMPHAARLSVMNPSTTPIDMSFATKNYMEKHRLLQGLPAPSKSSQAGGIPRFLDITALKQQPKFL